MADFGKGGTRTVVIYHGDVTVAGTTGEYLEYNVDAQGGNPLFVYSCAHRPLIAASYQFGGHPMAHYAWRLTKTPASSTEYAPDALPTDAFVVSFSFLGAVAYNLTTNLVTSSGNLKQIVQQIEYRSQFPEDSFLEGLMVTWS